MLRSESSRSGTSFCKCNRASKPSFAEETSYPSLASNHETVLRTLSSLSTTNIRVLGEDMRETSTDYSVEAASLSFRHSAGLFKIAHRTGKTEKSANRI